MRAFVTLSRKMGSRNGAAIVFSSAFGGSNTIGVQLTGTGATKSCNEQAMMMRSLETQFTSPAPTMPPNSRNPPLPSLPLTAVVLLTGIMARAVVVVADIDTTQATGKLAGRFKPELYATSNYSSAPGLLQHKCATQEAAPCTYVGPIKQKARMLMRA